MADGIFEQQPRDIRNLGGSMHDAGKVIGDMTEAAKHEGAEMVDKIQDATRGSLTEIEAQIRKNPTQAALIAGGIGLLIGLILAR